MEKARLSEMFDNLLHIGNKTNYWNPRMKSFIYGQTNGVHVINLVKTAEQTDIVIEQMQRLNAEGKKILFVATKLQARDPFVKLAEETGNYYVTEKWVPGLLTNFRTIKKRISTYLKLLKDSETGGFDMLTKKEKASQMLELEKLDKAFKGLKEMKKIPEVVFVIDAEYESQAIKEANTLGITCFAVANTNGDPLQVAEIIPANTNSVKSLQYIAQTLKSGFKAPAKKAAIQVEEQEKISGAPKKTHQKKEEVAEKPAKKEATPKKASSSAKTTDDKPAKKAPAKKTQEK